MQKKILPFPYRYDIPTPSHALDPDAKRNVAQLLIREAVTLLKTASDRDAVIAELIEDCLKLSVQQLGATDEEDLIAF